MSNYFSIGMDLNSAIQSALSSANMKAVMDSYMTNSIFSTPGFNMDMSLTTPAWMQNIGSSFPQFNFSGLQYNNPFTPTTPYGTISENGENLTITEYAKRHGYEETSTSDVYKKDGKYYRYNAGLSRFVEVSEAEATQIAKADKEAARAKKADEYKEYLKENKSKSNEEAQEIAAQVYKAIKGAGTNEDRLLNAVKSINKDNVIEVWDMWNANHEYDFGEEGGFIRSIRDDVRESRMGQYERPIKEALIARAEALGLYEAADQFRSQDNHDYDSYDAIITEIRNKERE
ncbi:hypothetical protein IKE67_04355 [bacterium]|nr:hypothetical protein [bacterium]